MMLERNRANVLIVEDDATQGKALREALSRAGYQVTLCNSSVEAAGLASRQEFHCLVVDCMLPKMSGVDLVQRINSVAVTPPYTILYSGIFKDKNFQKDAINRTNAAAFLTKPFQMDELLNLVNAQFAEPVADDSDPLVELYGERMLDGVALDALFASAPTVPGIHLPMLYRRLQSASVTGELSMVTSTGDLNTVCLYNGRIFNVRTPDKETAFGMLAIGLGYLTPEDLSAALASPEKKLIGQKLIEGLMLSPHATHLVMEEQLALRLSQTIEDGALTVNWTAREFPAPDVTLGLERFDALALDWTHSKIEAAWIRDFLIQWGEHRLVGDANPRLRATTLGDLLSHKEIDDERDLPHLLRQLLTGAARLGAKQENADYRFLEARLTHMLQIYPTQNYFEVLGVGEKAHSLEINRAYEELRKHFDPAGLKEDAPPRVMLKATQVFKVVQAAYSTLSDEITRGRYVVLQQNQRSQKALEHDPEFRQAQYQVAHGQAAAAGETFQRLLDMKIAFPDLRAYRIWAGFAEDRRFKDFDFDKIAPEERHSAPYHMARGLYYKHRGDFNKAIDSFSAALVMDPRNPAIRSELDAANETVSSRTRGNLISDLTTQIGKKFRRGA